MGGVLVCRGGSRAPPPQTDWLGVCREHPGLGRQGHRSVRALFPSELQTLHLMLVSEAGGTALALNLAVQEEESKIVSNTVVLS